MNYIDIEASLIRLRNDKNVRDALIRLRNATRKRKLATATRMWIERTPYIHAFNYWYYRWLTNEFEMFLISRPSITPKEDNDSSVSKPETSAL